MRFEGVRKVEHRGSRGRVSGARAAKVVAAAVGLVVLAATLVLLVGGRGVFWAVGDPGDGQGAPSAETEPPTVNGVHLESVVAGLETVIPESMERWDVAGVSVAVIGDGQVLWAKGYGTADKSTGAAVTEKTMFLGASFSKTMTGYLALGLVEQGLLELDRPLIDYTGEAYLGDSRVRAVTLRMILTHTSGFSDISLDRGRICFTPGKYWSYSSDAFRYLQWVIEKVTGQPFADYAAAHLFVPLGMDSTNFVWRDEFLAVAAQAYDADGPVTRRKRTTANAAYGAWTTPSDYAQLVAAILNPVDGDPDRLGPETTDAMLTPNVKAAEGVWWGLGWGLEGTEGSPEYFWHWGWMDGFRNLVVVDRTGRAGVVVMTNEAMGLRVAEDIVQAVIPGEHPVFASMIHYWE